MQMLVTGATGYVAGHLIKRLLEAGHRVHATVRSLSKSTRIQTLNDLSDQFPDQLELFQADLLREGSFNVAMRGCEVVYHTASPFIVNVANPQRDLVDPAVKGTENVLTAANQTDSVRRVVVTSSTAALYGDVQDCARAPNGVLNEDSWNTTSNLQHNPYSFSKVLAEKRAWEMANAQDRWQLVTVNPSLVVGPSLSSETTSESFRLITKLGDGTLKDGVPDLQIGLVDVRDVAEAHLLAGTVESASGRYICNGVNGSFRLLADALRPFTDFPIPTKTLPKWLVWLLGPMVDENLSRSFVSKNLGHRFAADSSRLETLGLNFRDVQPGVREMFQQLIERGAVNPNSKK